MKDAPVIVLLHALGASARSFDAVVDRLAGYACIAIDLPGFGNAVGDTDFTVEEMADHVAAIIRARIDGPWVIVGHSMGGKIATILAARSEHGALPGLAGVVLIAASPPSPEPIDDDRRAMMIGWAAKGPLTEDEATNFVSENIAAPLPDAVMAAAVVDVRRSDSAAWLAWLERGSREDWSGRIGVLHLPALIVAGSADGDLGEANQRRLNAPHYANADVAVIDGAAHLMPLEQPAAVADLIRQHVAIAVATRPTIPPHFARLIASDRVSARTRAILIDRARPDAVDYVPHVLSSGQLATLRALMARVIPQEEGAIDLAARIDARLHAGEGDGWRFADLPADADAYRAGLDTLDRAAGAGGFAGLDDERRDALLMRIEDGDCLVVTDATLSPAQMALWFEDVRADGVRIWLAHPATMARIGYDGIASGGDGWRKQGFAKTRADDPERWEPRATKERLR
ncbi:alpha/beta hydrolase [Sphingomonas mollis]|uniref:Alpha/beta fold hydrolase n=1 Tax=Sphingomonas mollis TaxID=2795726 RepID=A0ABS0XVD3_9SPHN|nr:alpha/beta fold hydrolase [Sphingomonas sp. BT553]MBJ6123695.1 alpha/beta fold hydrolase [Sphingomonas sp. BT553]